MSQDFKDYVAFSIVGMAVTGFLGGLTYLMFLDVGWWSLPAMSSFCVLAWAISHIAAYPVKPQERKSSLD